MINLKGIYAQNLQDVEDILRFKNFTRLTMMMDQMKRMNGNAQAKK